MTRSCSKKRVFEVSSGSFQGNFQDGTWKHVNPKAFFDINTLDRKYDVYLLPQQLDEEVAIHYLPTLGAELAVCAQEQSVSRGVKVESCPSMRGAVCLPLLLHRVSIGDVEDFSLPGLALGLFVHLRAWCTNLYSPTASSRCPTEHGSCSPPPPPRAAPSNAHRFC